MLLAVLGQMERSYLENEKKILVRLLSDMVRSMRGEVAVEKREQYVSLTVRHRGAG